MNDDEDNSPPTPKQRDFPKQNASKSEAAPPPVTNVDNKTQEVRTPCSTSADGMLTLAVAPTGHPYTAEQYARPLGDTGCCSE